jgi:subtilisin family serine protease
MVPVQRFALRDPASAPLPDRSMPRLLATLLLLAAVLGPAASSADLAKLDRRARVALRALRAGTVDTERSRRLALDDRLDLDVFIGGPVDRAALEAAGARVRTALPGRFTASIPAAAVEAVAALAGVTDIRGAARLELELDASVAAVGVAVLRGAGPAFTGANGAGVLIGCVDSGVDFGHGDFQTASGATRLAGIWDQTGSGPAPPGFGYGTAWTPAQIDAGLCSQIDPVGHGTHVLGIAGGDGSQTGGAIPAHRYAGVAPQADLAMVRTNFTDTGIIDGVRYLFDLATARGQSAVVNISLGGHYGPHDGTSHLESMLSGLTGPGRIVVKSAGNDRLTLPHAEIRAATGLTATLSATGSATGATLTAIGFYDSSENLSLEIRTPSGTVIGPLARGASLIDVATSNGVVHVENGARVSGGGDFEVLLEVEVASGQNLNGEWSLAFTPVQLGAAGGEVDLWRVPGFRASTVWQNGTQPEELVTEPGNAAGVITVGAYVTKKSWVDCNGSTLSYGTDPALGSLAVFSSPGPTRDGRIKPDLAAPGQGIVSTTDFDVFPFCGTSSVYVADGLNHRIDQGTSMAAPHVAGVIALLLQSRGPLSPQQALGHLAALAVTDAFTGSVPNLDWGHGKLFVDRAVPALATLLQAAWVPEGVEIRWRLSTGAAAGEARLERSGSVEGPWFPVPADHRSEGDVRIALDRSPPGAGSYYYRLEVRGADGEILTLGPLRVDAGPGRLEEALGPVRPNPSRGAFRVEFTLPRPMPVRLLVLDLQGREIATLAEGPHREGHYLASWGNTGGVRPVPAGLYFVSLVTPDQRRTQRLVVAP